MKQETVACSIDFATLAVPPPTPTALSASFWTAAAAGRFELQRCRACRRYSAYPREICTHCWAQSQFWEPVSGRAHVQTFTRVHQAGHPGWQIAAPYVVALVRLVEGPVLLTQLLGETRALRAGAECRVAFIKVGDWTLPFFRLTDESERASLEKESQ